MDGGGESWKYDAMIFITLPHQTPPDFFIPAPIRRAQFHSVPTTSEICALLKVHYLLINIIIFQIRTLLTYLSGNRKRKYT